MAPSEEEKEYWLKLIRELQGVGYTIARISDEVGVSERQVASYKTGERPKGMTAIKLHNLHLNAVVKAGSSSAKDEPDRMAEAKA